MWWARQDSNLQPDRYERRGIDPIVDFAAFSFEFASLHCILERSLLVRNWGDPRISIASERHVVLELYRGFESHSLRQYTVLLCSQSFGIHNRNSRLPENTVLACSSVFHLVDAKTVAFDRGFGG
jgi:hypothetical protein